MSDAPRPGPRKLGPPQPLPTRPGQRYRALIGSEDGVHELFVGEATFEPGSAIPLHQHVVIEAFAVLEGTLTFRLGDQTLVVEAEQTVTIPSGVPHAIVNNGSALARAVAAAPWDHATFFRDATRYLEGIPRD
jgi:quercetin dioxygenase-like cupin family protein